MSTEVCEFDKAICIEGGCEFLIYDYRIAPYITMEKYSGILEYSKFLDRRSSDIPYLQRYLKYRGVKYDMKRKSTFINGKSILNYTEKELKDIMNSEYYFIGPDSTLPDIEKEFSLNHSADPIIEKKFSIDDYYCKVTDGKLFISTNLQDNYPCKNGVLELVIKHCKPDSAIINKNDKRIVELFKHLIKYDIATITIV